MKRIYLFFFLLCLSCGQLYKVGSYEAKNIVNRTTALKDNNSGWVPLREREKVDEYTRVDSVIFCGEIACDINPMEGINTESFQVWAGSNYAKDKERVYYPKQVTCIDYTECGVCYCSEYVVENADPNTFKYLDKEYATDGSSVYFRGKLLADADGETFQVIEGPKFFYFAIDKSRVYKHDKIFEGADPKTFYYDKEDKRNNEHIPVYIIGDKDNKWEFIPPNTFKALE